MESSETRLVRQGDIPAVIEKLKLEHTQLISDLKMVVETVQDPKLKKGMEIKLEQAEGRLQALEDGFVPVQDGWFARTDTKAKWLQKPVRDNLATMPQEIKDAWERVRQLGLFKSFSVTTMGADPILVGNIGGAHFLIGAWVNLPGNLAIGFTLR